MPTDLLSAERARGRPWRPGAPEHAAPSRRPGPRARADRRRRAAARLGRRRRARRAAPRSAALAERLAAPVLTTYGGARRARRRRTRARRPAAARAEAGALWDEADLVIAIGTDLDGMNTQNWPQPQPPALVAINVDPADAAKNYRAGRARGATRATVERAPRRAHGARRRSAAAPARACGREACRALDDAGRCAFLAPSRSRAARRRGRRRATCASPATGSPASTGPPAPRKLLYPMGWGTLGFGFPAALGAALAGAGPTVSISGDGGFLFACGELATWPRSRSR